MNIEQKQNNTVVQQFSDAWNSRQPEACDNLIKSDVVRRCNATSSVGLEP
jgi:hypothetical protein